MYKGDITICFKMYKGNYYSKPGYRVWMFKEGEQNTGKMIADHAEPSPAKQNKNKVCVIQGKETNERLVRKITLPKTKLKNKDSMYRMK